MEIFHDKCNHRGSEDAARAQRKVDRWDKLELGRILDLLRCLSKHYTDGITHSFNS